MKFSHFIILLIIIFFHPKISFSNEKFLIKLKIGNQIITNFDLNKEINYLTALNPNLININEELKIVIAKDSIAKEIIKTNELKKYFELNDENIIISKFIKTFYRNLGIEDEIAFEKYLNQYGWTLDEVKQKIKIEVLWNQLIFEKFKNQVRIDKIKLMNKIDITEGKKFRTLYNISEIIFQVENNKTFEKTIELINKSISEIGFENTANLYSVSESAKIGGKIGWVDENSISLNLSDSLKKINIGEHTKAINLNTKFIILKLNDVKEESRIIDKKKELAKLIKSEENLQLDNFSKIFFDKIKINIKIDEY